MSAITDFDETEDMSGETSDCHVGADLQDARRARNEDIETISETLKIRVTHLRALEAGRWDELPADAYVVGFLKSYARYLGLDPAEMARRYRTANAGEAESSRLLFPEPIEESRVPKGPLVMLSAFLALVGYGLWYVTAGAQFVAIDDTSAVPPHLAALTEEAPASDVTLAAGSQGAAPTVDTAREPAEPTLNPVAVDVPRRLAMVVPPEAARRETVTPPATGRSDEPSRLASGPALIRSAHAGTDGGDPDSRVLLQAQSETWIQVRGRDGAILREGVLNTGEQYRAPDAPGVTLTTSNIGALTIKVDGEPVTLVGTSGTVEKELPLNPKGLAGFVQADLSLD